MKTITSFLIGTLLVIVSLFLLGMSFTYINLSTYYFTQLDVPERIYEFQLTFLFIALVQAALAIVAISFAILSFQKFAYYYRRYLNKKRDNDIKKQVENAKYDDLYSKLKDTNIPEQQDKIVDEFYNKSRKDNFESFKEMLRNAMPKKKSMHINEDIFGGL